MESGESQLTRGPSGAAPADTSGSATVTPALGMSASPASLPGTPTSNARSDAVARLLEGERGVIGVVMARPEGGILVSRNADTPFIAASLYKLILMADIYRRIEAGELALSDPLVLRREYFPAAGELPDGYWGEDAIGSSVTVEEALFATGAYSSNIGARALLSLTDTASLDAMAQRLGLTSTHLFVADLDRIAHWPPQPGPDSPGADLRVAIDFITTSAAEGPVNITTPRDMARFFDLLWKGEVLSPSVSAEILHILSQQAVDDRFPFLVPPSAILAHKTGNLDHVVHDVGIIQAPDGPIVVAAMIEAAPDDDRATQIIQRLALIAYGRYDVPALR
ncbi:MAG: hypothetical protein C4346_15860 [Chloroflexota bacterium]